MYIVTYEELDQKTGEWVDNSRMATHKEMAIDFMKFMYESGMVRDIQLWDAKEIKHRCTVKATIKFDE